MDICSNMSNCEVFIDTAAEKKWNIACILELHVYHSVFILVSLRMIFGLTVKYFDSLWYKPSTYARFNFQLLLIGG